MIRFLALMQSKIQPKSQLSVEEVLMVNKKMRKFRERNKKFIISYLCINRECKRRSAFYCGDVIYYLN